MALESRLSVNFNTGQKKYYFNREKRVLLIETQLRMNFLMGAFELRCGLAIGSRRRGGIGLLAELIVEWGRVGKNFGSNLKKKDFFYSLDENSQTRP